MISAWLWHDHIWPYSVNNVAPSLFSPMIYLYFRLNPWSSHWSSCHSRMKNLHHFLLALSRPLLQAPDWHRKWANHPSGTCAPVCRDGRKCQSQTGWDSAAFVNYLEIDWHSDPGSPIKNLLLLLLLLLFQYYSSAKLCQETIIIILFQYYYSHCHFHELNSQPTCQLWKNGSCQPAM